MGIETISVLMIVAVMSATSAVARPFSLTTAYRELQVCVAAITSPFISIVTDANCVATTQKLNC